MLEVLPINSVREEDKPLIGLNLYNLAKLKYLGFPVPNGIIVTPPEFKLKTTLEYFDLKEKEVFEQKIELIRAEIAKIPIPPELEQKLQAKNIDPKKIWLSLLEKWISEIRSRLWGGGFSKNLTANLTAQPIFFTDKIIASGSAYYHHPKNQIEIKITDGSLSDSHKEKIEDLVKKANKKLILPQIYYWIVDKELRFIKVSPFTDYPKNSFSTKGIQTKTQVVQKSLNSVLKVYLNLDESLNLDNNIDGVIISSDKFLDNEKKLWHLIEVSSSFRNIPIIYKLPDHAENFGGLRGALRLIHDQKLLKQEVSNFLFARNKKQFLNVHLAIPYVRSVNEFLQIKRDLAALGVNRKGSLKLWLETSTPENLLNLDEYLVAGVDGVILNLDELASWINGFDPNTQESIFYQKQIKALIKLLEDGVKILHKAKIPVIATGKLVTNDELLIFLIDKGIYAISVDKSNAYSISEYLHLLESRRFHLRLN